MLLREKIENNPAVFFLGTVLAGFIAGISAYQGALAIMHLKVVPEAQAVDVDGTRGNLVAELTALKKENERFQALKPAALFESGFNLGYAGGRSEAGAIASARTSLTPSTHNAYASGYFTDLGKFSEIANASDNDFHKKVGEARDALFRQL